MEENNKKLKINQSTSKIVAIVGPTASGKSDLAVKLAKKFNGEVISADSRQVYRGMDIGTGKITKKEMKGIRHYLLDVASPKQTFTVAKYQKLGKKAIKEIIKKGKLPIVCGGTGFYVDALLYNYDLPQVPPDQKLRKKLEKETLKALFEKLRKLDPERAKTIDKKNKRRLIRALEIIIKTRKPVPKLQKNPVYNFLILGIKKPKKVLRQRIKDRLLKRIKKGMIKEVLKIKQQGISWKKLESFGLEYRWVSWYLQQKIKVEKNKKLTTSEKNKIIKKLKNEMIEKLNSDIWQYARRQLTWFKKNPAIIWIKSEKEAIKILKRFLLKN